MLQSTTVSLLQSAAISLLQSTVFPQAATEHGLSTGTSANSYYRRRIGAIQAALAPPAAGKRIRSSSQMRAEALQERDLNSRLAAVDEYLGTLRDETLQNLKDTLNQIFRSGKVKLVPRGSALSSSFSTDDKLDSFADEIRQIAKEHWLNVVIISDIAERFLQDWKFAKDKTDTPYADMDGGTIRASADALWILAVCGKLARIWMDEQPEWHVHAALCSSTCSTCSPASGNERSRT